MSTEYISRKGYAELYQTYLDFDNQIAQYQKEMGESAKRDNDLRENPEYMALRVKVMYTLPEQKKIAYERYRNAIIIEDSEEYKNFDGTTIIKGTQVRLLIDGKEKIYTLLGSNEGNLKQNIISCDSPIAKALLSKKVGESIKFNNMEIVILSVKKA